MNLIFVGELLLLGLVGIIVYSIYTWNQLRQMRHLTQESWGAVALQLKRRSDSIPHLLTLISQVGTLQPAVSNRLNLLLNQSVRTPDPSTREQAENEIETILDSIATALQNYPQLQESPDFMQLMYTISDIEEKLQISRENYNDNVHGYNMEISFFPNNILAQLLHFSFFSYFQADKSEPIEDQEIPEEDIPYVTE